MKKSTITAIIMVASSILTSTNASAEITQEYIQTSFHDAIILKACNADKLLPNVKPGLVQFYAKSTLEEFAGYGYSISDIMNTLKSHERDWISYYSENVEEYKESCAALNEALSDMSL